MGWLIQRCAARRKQTAKTIFKQDFDNRSRLQVAMRIFPILTSIVVAGVLVLFILKREEVLAYATGTNALAAEQMAASGGAPENPDEDAATESRVSVVAQRSMAQSVDSAVVLRGQTEAARQVVVKAETSGLVASEPLRKGARIAADQLLCKLETGTRNAGLAEAEARLAEAQINFNAVTRLVGDGFASETRLASARAALQTEQASVEVAQGEIDRLEIRAPFAGLLESDTAELGALMQPGAPCATIIQLRPIKLVGFVPETEVDRITTGAPASARLVTGREVSGRVTFLSRSADPLTRTFRVEIEVANDDLAIRDGQTAEIVIASDGSSAHLLPQSALTLDNDGRLGVRLVGRDDRAAFAPVILLRDTRDGAWLAGLPEQTAVIVSGQEFVTDGVALDVTYKEPSP